MSCARIYDRLTSLICSETRITQLSLLLLAVVAVQPAVAGWQEKTRIVRQLGITAQRLEQQYIGLGGDAWFLHAAAVVFCLRYASWFHLMGSGCIMALTVSLCS